MSGGSTRWSSVLGRMMLAEFETHLADVLGSRLPAPLTGLVDRAPGRLEAHFVVTLGPAVPIADNLQSLRAPSACRAMTACAACCGCAGRSERHRRRAECWPKRPVHPALDTALFLLDDPAFRTGTALLPADLERPGLPDQQHAAHAGRAAWSWWRWRSRGCSGRWELPARPVCRSRRSRCAPRCSPCACCPTSSLGDRWASGRSDDRRAERWRRTGHRGWPRHRARRRGCSCGSSMPASGRAAALWAAATRRPAAHAG